jgi:hypothetical protein
VFPFDEAQHADVLLFVQELMEQTVAIVSRRLRNDAPGRLRGHKIEVLTASDSLRTELKPP